MHQMRISLIFLLVLNAITAGQPSVSASPDKDLQHTNQQHAEVPRIYTKQLPHHGRSLKQMGSYDPYGIGYYDPYVAGVTPGFVNVDLNRETGLHVDVGTVAVDVSADKNYYGLGVGNLVGVGAAKDRGWNLQLGGGNILDVSVTKDAGLGLWLLNGLANIQIGPDTKTWETGHIAAQSVPGSASSAAAAGQPSQPVTSVVVDEAAAGGPAGQAGEDDSSSSSSSVHVAAEGAATAADEPIITEEPIRLDLSAAAAAPAAQQAVAAVPAPVPLPRSSAARRARPRMYVQPRPASGVQEEQAAWVQPVQPSDAVVVPVAEQGSAQSSWTTADAQPRMVAGRAPMPTAAEVAVAPASMAADVAQAYVPGDVLPAQQQAAGIAALSAAAPRRACEGGTTVAAAGNKFKCRYRRSSRQDMAAAYPSAGMAALG